MKDKNNRTLDVSKWESDFPQDIPEQLNGHVFEILFVRVDVYETHIIINAINVSKFESEILHHMI